MYLVPRNRRADKFTHAEFVQLSDRYENHTPEEIKERIRVEQRITPQDEILLRKFWGQANFILKGISHWAFEFSSGAFLVGDRTKIRTLRSKEMGVNPSNSTRIVFIPIENVALQPLDKGSFVKIKASVLTKSVPLEITSGVYAQKIASTVSAGQSFDMVDGSRLRIHQVASSPDGMVFATKDQTGKTATLTLKQFAALGPVSPAMRRLASFVRLALSKNIDLYVKEAIKAAGLPVDPTMNWSSYINKVYAPLFLKTTNEQDLWDDAVSEMLMHELFENKFIQKHFKPQDWTQDEAMDKKVTAFLKQFVKFRREQALINLKKLRGIGTGDTHKDLLKGEGGSTVTGLESAADRGKDNTESSANVLDMLPESHEKSMRDINEYEGMEDVQGFLDAFKEHINDTQHGITASLINMITDYFLEGLDRKEIREKMLNDPNLKTRSGKQLDIPAYNFIMQTWGQQVKKFAQESGYADLPIAKLISNLATEEKAPKKPAMASLVTAAPMSNPVAPAPAASVPSAAPTPAPPPTNPNVAQQQSAMNQQQMNDRADEGMAEVGEANKTQGTVPPEIPGSNHGAPKPTAMNTNQPVTAAYWPRKEAKDGYDENGFWVGTGGGASGILPICSATARICVALRGPEVEEPGTWGTIGGANQGRKSPADSAKAELLEETGYSGPIDLIPAYKFSKGSFFYQNFIGIVPKEFPLRHSSHSEETEDLQWMTIEELMDLPGKHFGLVALLKNSGQQIEDLVMKFSGTDKPLEEEDKPMPVEEKKPVVANKRNAYAALRHIAMNEPQELKLAFDILSSRIAAVAENINKMTANLDLSAMPPAPDAKVAEKVTFRNKFAKKLKVAVEENPEGVEKAMSELNTELEEILSKFHTLADNLGVKLEEPKAEEINEETFETPNPETPAVKDEVK